MRKITLGADPEFCIHEKINLNPVNACTVIRGASLSSQVGHDGSANTGEFRLRPSSSASGAFKELKRLINVELPKVLDTDMYDVTAGSGKFSPTGGHIHFGGIGHHPTEQVLRGIWAFISNPLNQISDTSNRDGDYGSMGDYHEQDHGMEIRSPLSWIVTPRIAKGVFTISAIIGRNSTTAIRSWDKLLELANKQEKQVIMSYRKELQWFRDNRKVLEEISVIKAWKRRKLNRCLSTATPSGFYPLSYSSDLGMSNIFGTSRRNPVCRMPIRIVGARADRHEDYAIFVPANWDFPLPNKIDNVFIVKWENMVVGISIKLRMDADVAKPAFRRFIKILNSLLKKQQQTQPARQSQSRIRFNDDVSSSYDEHMPDRYYDNDDECDDEDW